MPYFVRVRTFMKYTYSAQQQKFYIPQQVKGQSWSTLAEIDFFIYKINTKVHEGVSDSSAGVAKSQKMQAMPVKLVARMLGQSSD